jgi:hypothetical protein
LDFLLLILVQILEIFVVKRKRCPVFTKLATNVFGDPGVKKGIFDVYRRKLACLLCLKGSSLKMM